VNPLTTSIRTLKPDHRDMRQQSGLLKLRLVADSTKSRNQADQRVAEALSRPTHCTPVTPAAMLAFGLVLLRMSMKQLRN
jgi:hypothetical protein